MHNTAKDVAKIAGPSPEFIQKACARDPVNYTVDKNHELALGFTLLLQEVLSHQDEDVRKLFAPLGPTETGL